MNRRGLIEWLAASITAIQRPHPVRVAIDGVDAAGKTTLADEVATAVAGTGRQAIRASVDGFHNPAAVRYRRGADSPDGYFEDSFNHQLLVDALLRPLGPGGSREFRRVVFDFRTDAAVEPPLEQAAPDAILILDGVFLLRPELRGHFDFSVFVRASFDVTIARAERRDLPLLGSLDAVRERYRRRYVPGQQRYLTGVDPERWATVVVDNNDPLKPFLVECPGK